MTLRFIDQSDTFMDFQLGKYTDQVRTYFRKGPNKERHLSSGQAETHQKSGLIQLN